jgi:hypothetical protein
MMPLFFVFEVPFIEFIYYFIKVHGKGTNKISINFFYRMKKVSS